MNNVFKILLTLSIVVVSITNGFAQKNTDSKLAAQFYANKEYDKAIVYYQKLFDKTQSPVYYVRLLNCLTELKEYKNAEKLIKRQIKRHSYQLEFHTDLGNLYSISNQNSKSKQAYDKALKLLSPNNQQIIDLANGYLKYKESEYAIQTYLKGRRLLKGSYPFNFELAQVYNFQGNTEAMLNEYLNLLAYQESYIQSVQNALQTTLVNDGSGDKRTLLKTLLIKKIQKNSDKKVFSEMLIWVYIQEKNFNGAFIQAKALDKRQKERGKRIMALASLSVENEDYEVAIKCYNYVIAKGDNNYYYIISKMELVNVYNQKIVNSNNYNEDDLLSLEKTYQSTILELGESASTAPLLRGLARLQAFYLHDTEKAIELLNEIIAIPRLKPHDKASAKIELADVLLFTGKIWEASLLYSQVEKAYKYDQLGERAKFKNARISFYTGDFSWAKTQLDVLKASTSKLIANDAMQLSITITDNIGIDTTEAPLLMFATADLLAFQNKNEEAMWMLDSLKLAYPNHTIADDILYKRYQINYKQKKFEVAAQNLEAIVKDYSFDILADDAIYNLALLYDNQLDDKKKAAEFYKKIMFDYQSSIYVVDSRKRYRELRDEIKIIKIEDDVLEFEAN
ncbi:MAG: tetratricopeptide repeat protein [Flavobacteriales bacterium]|nr:tetratricopeptide repeat protein [Flavobacteriales bacterium]